LGGLGALLGELNPSKPPEATGLIEKDLASHKHTGKVLITFMIFAENRQLFSFVTFPRKLGFCCDFWGRKKRFTSEQPLNAAWL